MDSLLQFEVDWEQVGQAFVDGFREAFLPTYQAFQEVKSSPAFIAACAKFQESIRVMNITHNDYPNKF